MSISDVSSVSNYIHCQMKSFHKMIHPTFRHLLGPVALAWSAAMGFAADVSGKWQAEFDSPRGHQKYQFDYFNH